MNFKKIIKQICKEENIDCQIISDGWGFVLKKNDITKYIFNKKFSLNNQAISLIIDDKYALYDLCKLYNIPVIEHQIIYNPESSLGINSLNEVAYYFKKYNKDIVLKPNNGNEGNDVYHITNQKDLNIYLKKLFNKNFSISLCPYYNIESEYRIVILDGVVKLIYEKVKPLVVGNGINTIKELLISLNPFYFKNKKLDEKYNVILKKGEKYLFDWRFNLSKGAIAKFVNNKDLEEKLSKMALGITNKIGATFVNVDIVLANNKFYLLEINSSVCINKACYFIDKNYSIVKNIYKEAILKMFEENN